MRRLVPIVLAATLLAAGCTANPGLLSNPDAVKLYRLSPSQYVAAVGCAH